MFHSIIDKQLTNDNASQIKTFIVQTLEEEILRARATLNLEEEKVIKPSEWIMNKEKWWHFT